MDIHKLILVSKKFSRHQNHLDIIIVIVKLPKHYLEVSYIFLVYIKIFISGLFLGQTLIKDLKWNKNNLR